nr:MAG TPA: hypothetical protein [Caudoviricetes sp.]DAZ68993.1 MAG TPA: hypothetical protein [Caudoviricetes sp.]
MALEYIPFYYSYRKKLEKLSDQEVGRLVRSLLEYGETGETEELAGRESIAFDFIADDINRAKAAYEERCAKNQRNIEKRYARQDDTNVYDGIRTNTNVYETYQTKDKPKDKTKDKTKDNSLPPNGVSDTRAKRFTPPTLDDVSAYIRERGSNVDAQRFLDFYTAKGWMVGKNRMKDWKAAVRTWEKRDSEQNKPFVYDYGNTEGSL